jgi:thiamine biosynthesis protein ThiI
MFEERLAKNIKRALKNNGVLFDYIKRISGRILVSLPIQADQNKVKQALSYVFGVAYFTFAKSCKLELADIGELALDMLKEQSFNTFRVETKRSNKNLAFTSQDVNEQVGALIKECLGKQVNLDVPEITLFIELVDNRALLYWQKEMGLGGLPVGVSGKAIALLSGGIDSPVAAFYALKRGAEVVFAHFHSAPYTSPESLAKVLELAKVLKSYQGQAKVFLAPFSDIQKEIVLEAPAELRVILYRRFMLRLAQKIAKKEKAQVLVTGESIGQVASQTLANMLAIEEAIKMPVLRPLAGWDKQEIIAKARQIGTYDISVQPHQDCCSRFLPQFPATGAKLTQVKQAEKNLKKIKEILKEALKNTQVKIV